MSESLPTRLRAQLLRLLRKEGVQYEWSDLRPLLEALCLCADALTPEVIAGKEFGKVSMYNVTKQKEALSALETAVARMEK